MYRNIRLFTIVIVLMLSACSLDKPANYYDELRNLGSKQIIEYYFNAWNEKQYEKMNAVLSDEMKTRTFAWESVQYVSVISNEQTDISNLPDTAKGLEEVDVYRVEISVKRNNNNATQEDKSVVLYYVGKKTNDSLWLIYEEKQQSNTRGLT